MSKRSRYENANMRGGLGVRKRLSEDSLRETYRLNGVQTGSIVARCIDKFGRWELGHTFGIILRKTASSVTIRWHGDEEDSYYQQGAARYEVDRGRWRIMGVYRGNPLEASGDPIMESLTSLLKSARMGASANAGTPTTEETEESEMAKEMSNAAAEREAAKRALKNGDLKDRDTYTAKQVATRCGTDAKTMRKFFRSSSSTVDPVGQGGRYEFDAKDLPKIKREFDAWSKRAAAKKTQPRQRTEFKDTGGDDRPTPGEVRTFAEDAAAEDEDFDAEQIEAAINDQLDQEKAEPSDEDLEELEDMDLDDLDAEDD